MPDAQFTIPALPVVVPVALVAAVAVGRGHRGWDLALRLVWVGYGAALVWLTLFPLQVALGAYANRAGWASSLNLLPLVGAGAHSFVLNVALFVPLGGLLAFAPMAGRRRFGRRDVALVGLGVSLAIEVVQLVLVLAIGAGRSTDVNDLIANTIGALLGFAAGGAAFTAIARAGDQVGRGSTSIRSRTATPERRPGNADPYTANP